MVVSLPVVNSQDINPEDGVSFSFDSPVGKFDNSTISLETFTSMASCFKSEVAKLQNNIELAKFENNTVKNFTGLNFLAPISIFSTCLLNLVSGFYEDTDLGFKLDIPPGWSGFKPVFFPIAIVVPDKSNINSILTNQSALEKYSNLEISSSLMQIIGFNFSNFDKLKYFLEHKKLDQCIVTSDLQVMINKIEGHKLIYNCERGDNPGNNTEYLFATRNDSLISISFWQNSSTPNPDHLSHFDESIKSVKISNPINVENSLLFQIYQKYLQLMKRTS